MIAYLEGKIIVKNPGEIILLNTGVGYQVFLAESVLKDLSLDQDVAFYIYHNVREEASDLYGFALAEELELFKMLISVSGVGPKTALGVFNICQAGDLREAISRGDASLLTKVSGIGSKTAERIVLELKDKVVTLNFYSKINDSGGAARSDEIDALMALGYSLTEARQALNGVDSSIKNSSDRLKEALKKMNH